MNEARDTEEQAVQAPPASSAAPAASVASPQASRAGLAAGMGNAAFSGFVASQGGGVPVAGGAISSSLAQVAAIARSPAAAAPAAPRAPLPKPSHPGLARAVLARDTAGPAAPAAPENDTPQGTVEDAKKKAREEVAARKAQIKAELEKAIDSLSVPVPEVAKAPAEDLADRTQQAAEEWLNAIVKALEQKLGSLAAEIANSDVGKEAVASAKAIAQAVNDDPILKEVVGEVSRILKEIYTSDSASISKKIKLKGGKLAGKIKIEDITSGVTKASAQLELVTKSFTAKMSLDGKKVSIDMTAALAADTKLSAHLDETGGEVHLAMTTKDGKVISVPAKVKGGKGEVDVPAEITEAIISAKVQQAKDSIAAQVSGSLNYQSFHNKKGEVVTKDHLYVKVLIDLGPTWGIGLDAKYRNELIEAAVTAGLKHADGKTSAEIAGKLTIALRSGWSLYFGGNVATGPSGTSYGASAGVSSPGGGFSAGIGIYKGAKDGEVMALPSITFTF